MKRICIVLTLTALALGLCACGSASQALGGNLSVAVEAEGVYSISYSAQLQSGGGCYADNSALTGGRFDFDLSGGTCTYTLSALDEEGHTLSSAEFEDDFSRGDVAYLVVTEDLEILRAQATPEGLALMRRQETGDYTALLWDGRTYIPFCAVGNGARGRQLGIVNGNEEDQVYAYEGYAPEAWVVAYLDSGLMPEAILMREVSVTDLPEGLKSEYPWNG